MAKQTKDVVIRYHDAAANYYLAYATSYQPVFRYAFNQWLTHAAALAAIDEYNGREGAEYRLNLVEHPHDALRGPAT